MNVNRAFLHFPTCFFSSHYFICPVFFRGSSCMRFSLWWRMNVKWNRNHATLPKQDHTCVLTPVAAPCFTTGGQQRHFNDGLICTVRESASSSMPSLLYNNAHISCNPCKNNLKLGKKTLTQQTIVSMTVYMNVKVCGWGTCTTQLSDLNCADSMRVSAGASHYHFFNYNWRL